MKLHHRRITLRKSLQYPAVILWLENRLERLPPEFQAHPGDKWKLRRLWLFKNPQGMR